MILFVTSILLSGHLLLVDLAMMGPLAAAWFDWRATRTGQSADRELGRRLAWWSALALLAGSVPGLVLLAMRYAWDERYLRALEVVPRDRLWFAGAEFLFSTACLVCYAALWNRWSKWRPAHRLLALAGASNLLIHFPALFTVLSVLGSRPGLLAESLERSEYRRLLIDPEVLSRVVHVWIAAVAVTGLVIVWLALTGEWSSTADGSTTWREQKVRTGARLAVTATMLQFPIGIWVALAMPETARRPLMGADAVTTLAFLGALGLALLLVNLLSALILGEQKKAAALRATLVMTLVVVLMVATRLRISELAVPPQRANLGGFTSVSLARPLASLGASVPMAAASHLPQIIPSRFEN